MDQSGTLIVTPPGRLVLGSVFRPNMKDAEGRPYLNKDGQPAGRYFFGLAVSKRDPRVGEVVKQIMEVAKTAFPTCFDPQGNCTRAGFAFKIEDGDSTTPNTVGKRPCDQTGFPGHIIFKFSGSYSPPDCFDIDNAKLEGEQSGKLLRGHYAQVSGYVKGNDSPNRPGVYLNYRMVRFIGYGQLIGGVDPENVFGAVPDVLPEGASATPLAPAISMPTTPVTPAAAPVNIPPPPPKEELDVPAFSSNVVDSPSIPGAVRVVNNVQPNYDFLKGPPAVDEVKTYSINGVSYSEEQLKAAGYSKEALAKL